MTQKQINDGNRLIAKWLGYRYIPFNNPQGILAGWWHMNTPPSIHQLSVRPYKLTGSFYLGRSVKDLKYHQNWDWLMPVVIQIINHHGTLHINASQLTLSKEPFFENLRVQRELNGALKSNIIELVWRLVVGFIDYDTTGKI